MEIPPDLEAQPLVPRPATSADLLRIREIVAAAYEKYLSRMERPPAPMLRDYQEAIAAGGLWVVGDPVTGLVSLSPAGESLLIENVAVHPAAQGSGIGRLLMDFAEIEADRRRLRCVALYTNEVMTENLAIYSHLGYREVRRATEAGYRRVFMQKTLPASG